MTPLEKERDKAKDDLIEQIYEAANHQVPYYAYGDNEAASELAHRLELIRDDISTYKMKKEITLTEQINNVKNDKDENITRSKT